MKDLAFMIATELAPLIEAGEVSPVELTQQFLDRIEELDGKLRSYITVLPDEAIAQAKKAEEDIQSGNYKGPMHGIPLAIKDNYEIKNVKSTAGAKILKDHVPTKTAFSLERMLDEGAIILGKLNMFPLGAGSSGTNVHFGTTQNAWKKHYMPGGGSSSGSGAALAGGLATLTTGTDTFGSNRVPAAMSGVYGLKPTYGRVSSEGVIPLAWSLDHPGPITRSVSDLALMMNYMAGYNPADPASFNLPEEDYTKGLDAGIEGMTIGIPTAYTEGLDYEIEEMFRKSVDKLISLGVEVKEVDIPELSMSAFAGYVTMAGELAAYNDEKLKSNLQDFQGDVQTFLALGKSLDATQYLRAQQARRELTQAFKEAFEEVDMLVGPTVPITTPAYEENWLEQNLNLTKHTMRFTAPANLTGIPALAAPMELDGNGLPAGMQFIGNHLSEKELLQAAKAWETTEPIHYSQANVDVE